MSAAQAWIVLVTGVVAYVVGYDLWAHYAGRPTMSAQFHAWLATAWGGPVLFALLIAIPAALGWHFITYHRGR